MFRWLESKLYWTGKDTAMKNTLDLDQKCNFLYAALKEAQDNIRTYDTKAQIVGIGFIFTIGMVIKFYSWNDSHHVWHQITVITTWVLIIAPVICFGSVLYPTRRVAPHVLKNKEVVKGLFYMNEVEKVSDYVDQLNTMNIKQELTYELLKVSYLRDLKRNRFLLAMSVASFSLITIFLLQMIPFITWTH